jgi:hypothetical protein
MASVGHARGVRASLVRQPLPPRPRASSVLDSLTHRGRLAELGVDVRHVAVDGVLAQAQRAGDISVPHSPRDQPQDLPLAARERASSAR